VADRGCETSRSKPSRPAVPFFDDIPSELKNINRWLCWRYSKTPRSAGKFGKVPHSIADRQADITDIRNWLPFATAVQQYRRGHYDGIGIVLANGLVGVDLDDSVGPNASLDPKANYVLRMLNTYVEESVSGTGVHALAYGTLPDGRRKRGNFEMYAECRFFTVTGRKVADAPSVVANRTRELHRLHSEFLAELRQNRSRPTSSALEDSLVVPILQTAVPKPFSNTQESEGGTSTNEHLSDEQIIRILRRDRNAYWNGCPTTKNRSEADMALASKLAFYTGKDLERSLALFRQSALYNRPKCREVRDSEDYVRRTVRRACETQRVVWQPKRRARDVTCAKRGPGRPRCTVDPKQAKELRRQGWSVRDIARELATSSSTIQRIVKSTSDDSVTVQEPRTIEGPDPAGELKVSQCTSIGGDEVDSADPGLPKEVIVEGKNGEQRIPFQTWAASRLKFAFEECRLIRSVTRKNGDLARVVGRIKSRRHDPRQLELAFCFGNTDRPACE
jgi:primase-polymerase (primpol)-like protein